MHKTIAYLNGDYLPLAKARISVMDRGFLFGDGVYEVIPVYHNHPFRLEQHLTRLANSLLAIQLPLDLDLCPIISEVIMRNGSGDQILYLQITRGTTPERDYRFPQTLIPTVLLFSTPLHTPSLEQLRQGISAITVQDIRWKRCDIKAITLLASVLMRQQAQSQQAQEAILINNGFAIEGTSSNLFIVKDETLITAPCSSQILGGITRDLILEIAKQQGIPYREAMISEDDLSIASEIWITSSIREIVPVLLLNHQPVNDGKVGPLWERMINYYQHYKTTLTL